MKEKTIGQNSVLKCCVICVLLLAPIMQRGYDLGIILYIYIIILNGLSLFVLWKEKKLRLNRKKWGSYIGIIFLIIFLTGVSFLQPYGIASNTVSQHNLIIFINAIVLLGLFTEGVLETEKFLRIYGIFANLAMLFLLYQFISYYIGHKIVSGAIPFLTIESGLFDRSVLTYVGYARFSSFFIEPSYYGQFMAP